MEYTFVHKKGGWWLKLQSPEELADYFQQTKNRRDAAFTNALHSKELGMGVEHADTVSLAASLQEGSLFASSISFWGMVQKNMEDELSQYGALYVSETGGYFPDDGDGSVAFCRAKELRFPAFGKRDIRIVRYPDGVHFYAFLGDVQVRNGDTLKWNTYEEAVNASMRLTNQQEEDR